jgi:K+-transporting ATPase ATPase C chain
MMKHLLPAIMLTVVMTALTGLAYPLAMTGLAGYLFPYQAKGSLIERDGKIIGSELIGQNFTSGRYFHGRPSATTDTDPDDPTKTVPAPYNASNSAGSNLGPTSKALIDRVKSDTEQLAAQNPSVKIPLDLVTTSASGLDPDITPAAALFQVPRVAKARGVSADQIRRLIAENTSERLFGILGEPHVNVLKLNLALDKAFPGGESMKRRQTAGETRAPQEDREAVGETRGPPLKVQKSIPSMACMSRQT